MHKLVLVRHGESQWNLDNRFTGWVDVDLSVNGVLEAKKAGAVLKSQNFQFDCVYTSVLKRAIKTMWSIMEETDQCYLPVVKSWRLNERHYGGLQGLNKAETAAKHGDEQVKIWRRSYDVPPPPMSQADYLKQKNDPRYSTLDADEVPKAESLKSTQARFLPLWLSEIAPRIKAGERVLIVAHGNSLRSLIQYLDNMTPEAILELNIPTGSPLVYELDQNLKPIRKGYL